MGLDTAYRFRCLSMVPYGAGLNDWHVQSGAVIVGCGNLAGGAERKALLIVQPSRLVKDADFREELMLAF